MNPDFNPLATLSFIVAPAVLTNAASVMVMSTSNRLARAVDRARELSKELEEPDARSSRDAPRRLRELSVAEERTLMLLVALRSEYMALGGFALATLVSLLGGVLIPLGFSELGRGFEGAGLLAGLFAVGALVRGSVALLRETRAVVGLIHERAAGIHSQFEHGANDDSAT
jgi:hypothetical protein